MDKRKKVTLYFGSFNPIHNGHKAVAEYMVKSGLCDEIWFIISPHNPLKCSTTLLPQEMRYDMAVAAVKEWGSNAKVSDIEFEMERPSYTIRTLEKLHADYPEIDFNILIGEDNILSFDRWYRWQDIAANHTIYIYPRSVESDSVAIEKKIDTLSAIEKSSPLNFRYLYNATKIEVSSSGIRDMIKDGKKLEGVTAGSVINYIIKNRLYE